MPIQGILNTARSLSFYTRKQEVVANNLANANSDAFKADRIMARAYPGATFPVPVQTIDLQQGTFRETSRPLDVALSGPGFLVVHTADGDRLTRGGSLQLDPAGRLTDSHGDLVMEVRLEARIVHPLDHRVTLQPSSNRQGVVILSLDAQGQRLHSAQETVCVHGRQRCAVDLAEVVQLSHQ